MELEIEDLHEVVRWAKSNPDSWFNEIQDHAYKSSKTVKHEKLYTRSKPIQNGRGLFEVMKNKHSKWYLDKIHSCDEVQDQVWFCKFEDLGKSPASFETYAKKIGYRVIKNTVEGWMWFCKAGDDRYTSKILTKMKMEDDNEN